jgi:VanZ family protein
MDVHAKATRRVSLFWTALFVVLVIASVLIIWAFSLEGGRASSVTSNRVLKFLQNHFGGVSFIERIFGLSSADEYTVQQAFRKFAHFIEYALFGVLAQCLLAATRKMNGHNMLHTVSLGLLVAVIDETIQITTGRGPALADVWLDFVGVLCGCIVMWVLYGISRVFVRR